MGILATCTPHSDVLSGDLTDAIRVDRGAAPDGDDALESSDEQDLDELLGESRAARIPSSLPDDPVIARQELRDVARLLGRLDALSGRDSKLEQFMTALGAATDPVLSVARRMLLGVQPFSDTELNAEADRARSDALANAAFQGSDEPPPLGTPPGVTIDDLGRAHAMLGRETRVEARHGPRPLAVSWRELAADLAAIPLSPFAPELRAIGGDLRDTGERVPLVLESAEEGAFRVVVAVWAGEDGNEVIDRAERLEALMGTWDGAPIAEHRWREAHAVVRDDARSRLNAMVAHAFSEERAALQRQVDTARSRLLRELARFLVCAAAEHEELNVAFHRAMQRGGTVGALLVRAYDLVGYPEWESRLVGDVVAWVERLGANQRTNVLHGTPLEAAVRDPRWRARDTLAQLHERVDARVATASHALDAPHSSMQRAVG